MKLKSILAAVAASGLCAIVGAQQNNSCYVDLSSSGSSSASASCTNGSGNTSTTGSGSSATVGGTAPTGGSTAAPSTTTTSVIPATFVIRPFCFTFAGKTICFGK